MEFLLLEVEIITIELWRGLWRDRSLKIDDESWESGNWVGWVRAKKQGYFCLSLSAGIFTPLLFISEIQVLYEFWWKMPRPHLKIFFSPLFNQTTHKLIFWPIFSSLFSIHPIPAQPNIPLIHIKQGNNLFFLGHLHQCFQYLCL